MKYYFFRDLDNESNMLNERTYHAAGIVQAFNSELNNPSPSGKDVVVQFFKPFDGDVSTAYRAFGEIELFEVNEWEYDSLSKQYDAILSK